MIEIARFNYKIQGSILDNERDEPPITVWRRVFLFLKDKGYDVKSPGQKEGKCLKPYIVLKNGPLKGCMESNKVSIRTLEVIMFVPKDSYSTMEIYQENIIRDLESMKNLIKFSGYVSATNVDTNVDAHTSTIEYETYKKNWR